MTTAPLTTGSLVFLFLSIFAVLGLWVAAALGLMKKDDARIFTVFAVTTGLCTWLLWFCTWLHQWHPLVAPEYEE